MPDREKLIRRIVLWALAGAVMLPGVVMGVMAAVDHLRVRAKVARSDGLSPEQRTKSLYAAAAERDRRFAGVVLRALEHADDRLEVQAAGYAAMRLGEAAALPLFQRRIDAGPDDLPRAVLVTYAARLSNRDARLAEWLAPRAASPEPWLRAGAASGLLQCGRLEGGPVLVALLRHADADLRAFALSELGWLLVPMSMAIGQPLDWPAGPEALAAAHIEAIERFWRQEVTQVLLDDILDRLLLRDPDWAELGRLIHARNRVARWLR